VDDRVLGSVTDEPLVAQWVPPEIDQTKPHPARIYDVMIGGKDHFEVDRAAAEHVRKFVPDAWEMARANRAFLGRAVRFLAEAGITQFLDIGTGIPGPGNTGEVARAIVPDARVLYVDYDPIVAVHSRALLAGADPKLTGVLLADVRDPESILQSREAQTILDFDKPIGVLMVALLHFIAPDEDAAGIVEQFVDAVVPGSALVISHGALGTDAERNAEALKAWDQATSRLYPRTQEEITELFGDRVELVEPGVVQTQLWRPEPGDNIELEVLWRCGIGFKK
jgi:hypothetical protein